MGSDGIYMIISITLTNKALIRLHDGSYKAPIRLLLNICAYCPNPNTNP